MKLSKPGCAIPSSTKAAFQLLALTIGMQTAFAAAPRVVEFMPKTAPIGMSISILGEHFSEVPAENTVWFGGVRATVTSANSTNLTVTVPAGASFAPVSVTVNGLTAATPQAFAPTFLGEGGPLTINTFAPAFKLPVGDGPCTVVLADMDGDGKPDVIIGDGYGRNLRILPNLATNGSLNAGSFAPAVNFASPGGSSANPYKLTAADIDGDGKLDLVGCGVVMDQVALWRNTSVPGLISQDSLSGPVLLQAGPDTRFARAADLDGDGRPEIVCANYGNSTISVFRNLGGTFSVESFAPRVDFPCGLNPYELDIADLDGDGALDIAAVNTSSSISLFRNTAALGAFDTTSLAPRVDLAAPWDAASICIGDVDRDGKPDLVAGSVRSYVVSVHRNTSAPGALTGDSFAPGIQFGAGHWVHNVALADLNGDGRADLVSDGELQSYMSVFENLSTSGEFTADSLGPRVDFPSGWNAWGLAVGDLDADGRPDAIFGNAYDDNISVYKNIALFAGPPMIVSHPADRTVAVGEDALFAVHAAGSADLAYQWWKGAGLLEGATGNTLTIPGAQFSDAGDYQVVVTNSYGAATSTVAVLTVTDLPPHIIAHPQSQTALLNAVAEFSVLAGGSRPLSYQWLFKGTNLPGATSSSLTLTNVRLLEAGIYAVDITNALGSVRSSNALLTVIVPPARVLAPETTAPSGWPVTIPVLLVANGNENAVSFTLSIGGQTRSPLLQYLDTAPGGGAQGGALVVNTNQLGLGLVGIAVALPADATFSFGTQEVARITFDTFVSTTPAYQYLGFVDNPMPRQVNDTLAKTLPSLFTGASVYLLPSDLESDTAPRPGGDRAITLNDWVQAGRFAAGLEIPAPKGEFQRADCAPRETRGDGYLKVNDWVQSGRYFAKLDPLLAVGGPTSPEPGIANGPNPGGPVYGPGTRRVQITDASGIQGVPVEVAIVLESEGNENALGFTVSFDPALLRYQAAALGQDAAGAVLNVNSLQPGRLGLVMALPTGSAFAAGIRQLARVTFLPLTDTAPDIDVLFSDVPVFRAVSDPVASELQADFIPGRIYLTPPPALQFSLSGDQAILSWPAWAQDFNLQTSGSLTGTWTNLDAAPVTNGGELRLTLPLTGDAAFFRLHHP